VLVELQHINAKNAGMFGAKIQIVVKVTQNQKIPGQLINAQNVLVMELQVGNKMLVN